MEAIIKAESRIASDSVEMEHDKAIRHVMDAIQRVNEAILCAVDAGISVELVRDSRYHDGCGNWGDQMAPDIRRPDADQESSCHTDPEFQVCS